MDEFNFYIIQAYKLSKKKEACLDDLNEEGIAMFTPDDVDPRTVDLKAKLANKQTEKEFVRQESIKKKSTATERRASIAKSENSTSMNITNDDDDGYVIDLETQGVFNEARLLS